MLIEWVGCVFGLMGAAMLALNTRFSGWGFVLFLLSNICWIIFGISTGAMSLVVMQIGFTVTSMTGVYRWLWAKNPNVLRGS